MTNHVYMLVTPNRENAVSNMMQALGRRYVRYFNNAYIRSGTLWEGRFKSSLVQSESYLLQCQRYIELNPVRANIVKDPLEYGWSSYQCNALGKPSDLCTPHHEYLKLGKTSEVRMRVYRSLFEAHVDSGLLTDIRDAVNKGMALGSGRFKEDVELLTGRRVSSAPMGRPKQVISFI